MIARFSGAALAAFGLLLLAPEAMATQDFCQHSPENPTFILGLIAATAAGYPALRKRGRALLARRRGQQERSSTRGTGEGA